MKDRMHRAIFMGSPEFAVPSLESLHASSDFSVVGVVTSPPRPRGRSRRPINTAVAVYAEQYSLPIHYSKSLRESSEQSFISSLKPDVIVVAAFGQILPLEILRIPRFGAINVHASLLPKYRGASPIQSAILDGQRETGVTIMLMDEGMDTGPILGQISERIAPDDTSETLGHRLAHKGGKLVVPITKQFIERGIQPEVQLEGATVTRVLKKEDGKVDWEQTARRIDQMVRAYTPWPCAWTVWNRKRVRILQTRVAENILDGQACGTVVAVGDGIGVVCGGSTVLEILELQLEGKKPQHSAEFVRGYSHITTTVL